MQVRKIIKQLLGNDQTVIFSYFLFKNINEITSLYNHFKALN